MTPNFLDSVLRGAEALAARDPVGTLPDRDLLRRFDSDRDQAAVAVLVRRHGPLVWGVCRNLLPVDADAEDAFQATFLALVRSASSIRQTDALGGWLHGVAYRIAMKVRRAAARRKNREAKVASREPSTPVSDAAWDELQTAVHEEVCRLPEKLRVPFVLCGLQGRAQKDAAKQLGWKIGTFSGRLTQARQRLLERLAHRGIPVGMAADAAVLSETCGSAGVPSALFLKALSATAMSDAVSPAVISLARGVSHVYMTRTKLLVAGLLVTGVLTTGICSRMLSSADAQTAPVQDEVEKKLAYLRAIEQSKSRWEYKFVPVEKTLSTAELRRLLTAADGEGWDYCGTQDLSSATQKSVPHMVFKRPRNTAASNDKSAAEVALLALAQQNEKNARIKEMAEIEKQYALAVKAQMAEAAARADAAERERTRADQLAQAIQKARVEHDDALLMKIKELEAKGKTPEGAGQTLTIKLKNVKAQDAVKSLAKVIPNLKVVSVDERTNSIEVVAAKDSTAKLSELFATQIDVAPVKPPAVSVPATVPDFILIAMKNASASEVAAVLNKVFDKSKEKVTIVPEPMTNQLLIRGSPESIAEIKKLIAELDFGRAK